MSPKVKARHQVGLGLPSPTLSDTAGSLAPPSDSDDEVQPDEDDEEDDGMSVPGRTKLHIILHYVTLTTRQCKLLMLVASILP
jgi:hypothetical protein